MCARARLAAVGGLVDVELPRVLARLPVRRQLRYIIIKLHYNYITLYNCSVLPRVLSRLPVRRLLPCAHKYTIIILLYIHQGCVLARVLAQTSAVRVDCVFVIVFDEFPPVQLCTMYHRVHALWYVLSTAHKTTHRACSRALMHAPII